VNSEIEKYKMDLVGVQEIRWECNDTLELMNYNTIKNWDFSS
jgi:hypothetical protein